MPRLLRLHHSLKKDREALLAFYDFPAEHMWTASWQALF
jgi:hypothetical protein